MSITITSIHAEIEILSEERSELRYALSAGRDPELVAKIKEMDERLQQLWAAQRAERARIRFGDPQEIVRRARAEERLERAA